MQGKTEHFSALTAGVMALIQSPADAKRFNELALEGFAFQFSHNPAYRRFCESLNKTPRKVGDWKSIPAVVTSAFKEGEWTSLDPAERCAVFYSSGTTLRERSRHFHSRETLAVYEASLVRWFKPFVLPDCESAAFVLLSPPPAEAPNSSLVHMFATVSRAFGGGEYFAKSDPAGAWHLDFEKIAKADFSGPVVVCGTAFSFVHLCDWARENGRVFQLPEGSRVFETGGYKGRSRTIAKSELHELISEVLAIPPERIVSEYGMSELSSQAYDRRAGSSEPRLFRFPPWARMQVIDPETGAEAKEGAAGLIRVFDLANVGSVMALQTEDLGVRRDDGFELLGRAALVEPRGCSLMPA